MEETTEKIIFNKSLELRFMTVVLKNMGLENANKLNRKWNVAFTVVFVSKLFRSIFSFCLEWKESFAKIQQTCREKTENLRLL